ncbi:DNA mismatch repair protein MutS, partial [bacterium]|nr:DNA mismatch repair protein MutS [bacterium]
MSSAKIELKDSTPLMRQYFEIKSKYTDTVLLYRMGDFYETFDEDARTVHKTLGITLTKRANGKAAEVALAGFPHHALDNYLPKLIRAGFRVAVCEQLEDPKMAKGIVKRDVIEIVTPGTTLSDKILNQKSNNFLACVITDKTGPETVFGLSIMDASTGEFLVGEFSEKDFLDQMNVFMPSEIVVPVSLHDALKAMFKSAKWPHVVTRQEDWLFSYQYAYDILIAHFKTHSLKGFGVQDLNPGLCAAGAGLHYLKETQRTDVAHINRMGKLDQADFMMLDTVTLRNLEIVSSTHEGYAHGSLISILDQTVTAMGGRMLKQWITRPLKNIEKIQSRLDAVDELVHSGKLRDQLMTLLKEIGDLERLISKACANRINPREIRALCSSLEIIPSIKTEMELAKSPALVQIRNSLVALETLTQEINRALVDEPSLQIKDGEVIRQGFSDELDSLRSMAFDGKNYIANIQSRERERTGIGS